MRWTRALVFFAAAALAGCSGAAFSELEQPDGGSGADSGSGTGGSGATGVGGAGGSGTGGAAGAGGASGVGGAREDGGKACAPMSGCTPTSSTTCNDGCNTCSCFNGQWACTARACAPDAGQGACETDQDCIFRASSGCCGMCLAKADPIPPPLPCGAACSIVPPGCVCIDHKCGTGTIQPGKPCEPTHDLCSHGLMCCQQCGGPYLPDAQNCSGPVCTQPAFMGSKPGCPPPLP